MSTNNISVRQFTGYSLTVTQAVKQQMLDWGNQFNICCFMDNHGYAGKHQRYECILAAGDWKWIRLQSGNAFALLKAFYDHEQDWLFGHFGYDLKQETEQVPSLLPDKTGFPDCYFFVPEHLLFVAGGQLLISSHSASPDRIIQEVLSMPRKQESACPPVTLVAGMDRSEYIQKVEALKAHIHRGDCYEINFCQEFSAGNVVIDPVQTYRRLAGISPNPFSVYYQLNELHLLCASPERFLQVDKGTLLSQPIKGTAPRNPGDAGIDAELAKSLRASSKERSENVMVVDLVRNDLSRVCEPGSVEVEELFGIYTFPQVHQMISTVKGKLRNGLKWIDAVEAGFPMGSMTGAPKKRVVELIEKYELTRRGIFSGAVGYCTPEGDADFNVVIRSIMYNAGSKHLSCLVGSGITWYADPAYEYEECLLKAAAIIKALG
ncbi:aminobenzoate synthetase [Flavihumibacter solisilvae]|uniref:Aminobenzoate synthetase n=2 Tax=Flavihumibacter solisilvae TaxID=1349421 RepID=A0A0C1LBE3_9BACT|nr:aminobenzoate synthetase [Flavihumibacter solisilvae]